MRSSQKTLLFNGAVVLGITLTFLALCALADQFLKGWLGSLTESISILAKEAKTSQRLDEQKQQIHESGRLMDQLVNDLIEQRCDLRKAAMRWKAACLDPDLTFVRLKYHQGTNEEERIILHLFFVVGLKLNQQPEHCAEVLARLHLEKARLKRKLA
jgi:hypothetical protein